MIRLCKRMYYSRFGLTSYHMHSHGNEEGKEIARKSNDLKQETVFLQFEDYASILLMRVDISKCVTIIIFFSSNLADS